MEWYIQAGGYEKLELYNCSAANLTEEQWYARGRPQPVLGACLLAYGIIVELMYIPCITVISSKQYIKMSCYKIMTVLGIIDMFALTVNSITTGYLMIVGGVFCTHPNLIYIMGALGLGAWCAACLNCLLLVINRLTEIWKPYLMERFFDGHKTSVLLVIPVIYGLYFFFLTPPVVFTSQYDAWFFDPFIYEGREMEYMNMPHTLNNLLVVAIIVLLYIFFCGILASKFRYNSEQKMSWSQKSIFIQSTAICIANLVAALLYVAMNFLPTPPFFILLGHLCWQACHGFPAFVYIALNRTVQREVQKMFGCHIVTIAPSTDMRSQDPASKTHTAGKTTLVSDAEASIHI